MKLVFRSSGEVEELKKHLHLPDEELLKQFIFKDGDRELNREEVVRFLDFIRKELIKQ